MAERWQQWMPFHIDRFRGSPEVQAMHPAARWGYMSLLASQWQTEDCTLSPDPLDLASASGLGDELWILYGPRILRKFPPLDIGGRLRNDVCHVEWQEAKRIFDARSAAAKRTTEIRSPRQKATVTVQESDGHRAQTDTVTPRPADTITGTGTTTKEQKPSAKAVIKLPPWMDVELWEAYLEVRKKKRAVMTERALKGIIDRLAHFGDKGYEPMDLLGNSVRSNWIDIYEPKTPPGGSNGNQQGKDGYVSRAQQRFETSNAGITAAFDALRGGKPRGDDAAGAGAETQSGHHAGHGGDVRSGVGGDGKEVRPEHFQGVVIDGVA